MIFVFFNTLIKNIQHSIFCWVSYIFLNKLSKTVTFECINVSYQHAFQQTVENFVAILKIIYDFLSLCFVFFRGGKETFWKKFSFPHTPILQKLSKKGAGLFFEFACLIVKCAMLSFKTFLLKVFWLLC